ncbi:hypothetical protein CUMW_124450 [Citrus unshiu]|nr:hypothetical protein CUMW_124450 [Citrus unshiu]
MSRRPVSSTRRLVDTGSFPIGYAFSGSGIFGGDKAAVSRIEVVGCGRDYGRECCDFSCTSEIQRAIPILKKAYGDSMHKVLHVGPDTCSVVSTLLKEEETEAWGVEPYDIEDADARCKSLVHKGIVRVADIKFPLPYRAKSFPLVIVSDALDYLSPKYLNKTLPDLARVASDGVLIFAGISSMFHLMKFSSDTCVNVYLIGLAIEVSYPGQQRAKVAELSKFGRPAKMRSSSWWIRYFVQTSLEENEPAMKKFEQAASKKSYKPNCQVFHLKPLR